MKTTSFSPFQREAEVVDPPRNPGSTTAWWRWWWRNPAGLRQAYAGAMVEEEAARVGEAAARVWAPAVGAASYGAWGGRPPPLAPPYIGGSPKELDPKSS